MTKQDRIAVATLLGLAAMMLVGARPAPARSPAASAARLLPLSEADQGRLKGSGCNLIFDQGRSTLVFSIADELEIRTPNGLAVCRVGEAAASALFEGRRALTCGGRQLSIRSVGRRSSDAASDSSTIPAMLTITAGRAHQTVRGLSGTAC